jgi:3'(2'), 5'-bisphosphate nucleotidase
MNVLDHEALVRQLMPAVLAAGACLMRHRAAGVTAERKVDGSPVSLADREAEDVLVDALARAAPDVPVIAEERVSAGQVPAFDARAFLVDALDGTKEFLAGTPDFTVNIAMVADRVPVFGMVLAPAAGRLFVTLGKKRAAQAFVREDQLIGGAMPALVDISTVEPDSAGLRLITSRSHRAAATDAFLAGYRIAEDIRMGSSIKFGIIAAGEADLYPRFGPTSEWDIAAGHAVLVAAGGAVTTVDGKPFLYLDKSRIGQPEPFLNPPFVAWGRDTLLAR